MPIYEYQCQKCNQRHELMQKFSDAPLQQCPECRGPVKKLMSMTSFALKGTGWYTTDYKRSSSSSSSSNTSTSSEPSEASCAAGGGGDCSSGGCA